MDLCQAAGPRLQSRQSLPDDSPAVFFCLIVFVFVYVFVFAFPSSSPEQSLECPKASKMTRLLALCLVQPILRCPCHVMSKDYHRQDYFLGKCHGQWKLLLLIVEPWLFLVAYRFNILVCIDLQPWQGPQSIDLCCWLALMRSFQVVACP